ncbi:MAG: hypothetical protein IJ197_08695 [Bacteroidaceae bacterium]|nr:hypothetical protein [Bacteroidaceae bacterium]
MNPIAKFKARLTLDEAIKKADEAHAKHCERYYVMPNLDGKLVVMTKHDLKYFKRKGYVGKQSHVIHLIQESFYFTPYRNESGMITPEIIAIKRKHYFKWCDQVRKELSRKRKEERRLGRKLLKAKIIAKIRTPWNR